MMPNINPRLMKQAMKRMGIQQQEIDATEVIIKTPESEIVITEPQVSKVNMMGQETYQVVGNAHVRERSSEAEISKDDIKTVAEQAGVSEAKAQKALKETNGDLAEAILKLKGE
ncbi:nascent polypeptide-associated complex protein [Candidatus Woesearchaeota archaeon CG10_big_fil_rev_8_21_14_0_10_44_13]|nr:MAG: nascent polypeptide-associated complex protein [Candidatus Woesearchaeota archaeon CG10_big_fil_rev_8_21_14_0_10_44_13]